MIKPMTEAQRCERRNQLSCGGKFRVIFSKYQPYPEIREFITPPGVDGVRTRYINLCADHDAKLSRLIEN